MNFVIVTGGTAGLRHDAQIVREALAPAITPRLCVSRVRNGHALASRIWLTVFKRRSKLLKLYFENLPAPWLDVPGLNVLIPNQEWIRAGVEARLSSCHEIWCKTRYAEGLFGERGYPTRYIGFTSTDILEPGTEKQADSILHVAGRSHMKGTYALLALWKRHPEWPVLTVVTSQRAFATAATTSNVEVRFGHVERNELRQLMNRASIHLCPSEAEGYGHYIAEGMAAGGVVIVTDAPPMNEIVPAGCGLRVPYASRTRQGFGELFKIDVDALEHSIEQALRMPRHEREAMGAAARQSFLERREAFYSGLAGAVGDVIRDATETGPRLSTTSRPSSGRPSDGGGGVPSEGGTPR